MDLLKLAPSLLVLLTAVVGGAGRHPWVLSACVAVAVGGLLINKPPAKPALFFFWCVGMTFLLWHLFTLAPLPLRSLGYPRVQFYQLAEQKIDELTDIQAEFSEFQDRQLLPAADENRLSRRGSLTLNQAGTRRFILLMAGAWAMFWLSTTMTTGQRLRFLGFLVLIGAVVAGLGLFGRYVISPGNRVWWLFPVDHQVGGGPFINPNHFAFFCALLAPAALSLSLSPVPLLSRGLFDDNDSVDDNGDSGLFYGRLGCFSLFSWWGKLSRQGRWRFFYITCLLFLTAAPVLSFSSGGMVMVLLGCLTTSLFWLRGRPAYALAGGVVVLTILFSFLFWPSEAVQERVSFLRLSQETSSSRVRFTHEAFNQWRDFLWLGGGADSFRVLNGMYKLEPSTSSPIYAENEYVQFLADHGLVGAFLVMVLLTGLAVGFWSNFHDRFQRTRSWRVLRGTWARDPEIMRRHRELYAPVVSLSVLAAAGGAVVGLLFHFTCDFPARAPLNAFLAAALMGLAMPLPTRNLLERSHYWRWAVWLFAAGICLALLFWSGGNKLRLDEPTYLRRAELSYLTAAVRGAPTYWVGWYQMSQRLRNKAELQLSGEEISLDLWINPFRLYRLSADCLQVAAEYNHRDWRLWYALARARVLLGDNEAAGLAFSQAISLHPQLRQEEDPLLWNFKFDE